MNIRETKWLKDGRREVEPTSEQINLVMTYLKDWEVPVDWIHDIEIDEGQGTIRVNCIHPHVHERRNNFCLITCDPFDNACSSWLWPDYTED